MGSKLFVSQLNIKFLTGGLTCHHSTAVLQFTKGTKAEFSEPLLAVRSWCFWKGLQLQFVGEDLPLKWTSEYERTFAHHNHISSTFVISFPFLFFLSFTNHHVITQSLYSLSNTPISLKRWNHTSNSYTWPYIHTLFINRSVHC